MPMTSLTPTRLIGSFMVEKAQKTCSLDEVDTILEAWQALIPGTDLTPMAVFSRVSRLSRHLDVARREAFSSQDLEPWAFDVLAALRRSGAPFAMTPGALMLQSLVSSGTMTNRIDRLEERGFVRRTDHPEDRRAILVQLTKRGISHVDAAIAKLVAQETQWLGTMKPSEVQRLADLLRRVLLPFDNPTE